MCIRDSPASPYSPRLASLEGGEILASLRGGRDARFASPGNWILVTRLQRPTDLERFHERRRRRHTRCSNPLLGKRPPVIEHTTGTDGHSCFDVVQSIPDHPVSYTHLTLP